MVYRMGALKMHLDDVILESLLQQEEGPALDFKRNQYAFNKGSSPKQTELLRSKLVKDVLAFANTKRDISAFILIGVEEVKGGRSKVIGVRDHLDDEVLHDFMNRRTQRSVEFSYRRYPIDGVEIGMIEIPVQDRFLYLTQDYGEARGNVVYIRDGSTTRSATPEEIVEMSTQKAPVLVLKWLESDTGEVLPSPCLVTSLAYDPLLPEDTFGNPQNLNNVLGLEILNPNYSRDLIAYASDRVSYKPLGL